MRVSETDELTGMEALQLGLVRLQTDMAATGDRAVIVLEGRDAAGKDGLIKRLTEHLSVRNTRVVALPKPSDREKAASGISSATRRTCPRRANS